MSNFGTILMVECHICNNSGVISVFHTDPLYQLVTLSGSVLEFISGQQNTVEYRYNATNYVMIVTLSMITGNGTHWLNVSSQQTPHVPP